CSECGRTLSGQQSLDQHMRIHTGEKPFACPHCGITFRTNCNRNSHIRTVHRITCLTCGERFDLKTELNQHLITNEGHTDQE
ncbi:hypothetical protein PMAYCL1PPCAC_22445, partial [Pristionchus mayeri]